MYRIVAFLLLITSVVLPNFTRANVIGYDETFALAEDRAKALRELIPGTEDFYYYNALHHQQQGEFTQARRMIDAGVKKYNHSTRMRELENRQALLTFAQSPEESIKYFIRQLSPYFGHQRKQLKPEVKLPTSLDQSKIDTQRLMAKELRRDQRNINDFEAAAYDWLTTQSLTPDQRRSLLQRLQRPDYPGIVDLIAADLKYNHSRGFGKMPVHTQLLPEQLEALLQKDPNLIKNTDFINVYLTKLQPPAGSNWQQDDDMTLAYLQRLEAFTTRLPPVQNSLKANICYQRLVYDQRHGKYDRDRFMKYIRYPRPVHYINPKYRNRREFNGLQVNMNARFAQLTALPPIGMDEPLVRDYLMHFLKSEDNFTTYSDYIEHKYLKRCFAETKIVNGIGDQEQWYAMLEPEEVKRLRDRIDLELLPTNPTLIAPEETTALDVAIKNVEELIVKVYEINTVAYYREHMAEVSTDIDLDGLVPNHERKLGYTQPPLRRHAERLTFPEIQDPGVYVVELIGNGVSSRALIRKGQLRFSMRAGAAGHVFHVFNESGKPVPDAILLTAGREYTPDENGRIVVPFAGSPQQRKLILMHGGTATLWSWQQQAENYQLGATIHVERESLVEGESCRILVRPRLSVNDSAVDIALLEKPVLTIRSTDIDGTEAEKQVTGFELFNDRESIYEFKVPPRLSSLGITLSGKVQNLNTGQKQDVTRTFATQVNGIDKTEKVENLFLRHTEAGYFLDLKGRNGEPLVDRPVRITLKNHFVRDDVDVTLKTDANGRVTLGALKDIDWVRASATEKTTINRVLPTASVTVKSHYKVMPTEKLYIPLNDLSISDPASELSLLEMRSGKAARNAIGNVTIKEGYLVITGLTPGDYQLAYRRDPREIKIAVGEPVGLENEKTTNLTHPGLQIRGVQTTDDNKLRIRVMAATPDTRVHLAVSRFHHDANPSLISPLPQRQLQLWRNQAPESKYLSGRKLGDEYRYIMERRSGKIFPGNMLTRPSLLLNPWKLRTTRTGIDRAEAGGVWGADGGRLNAFGGVAGRKGGKFLRGSDSSGFQTVDFLPNASAVLGNLKPDDKGIVEVSIKELGNGQQIHVFAVNAHSGVYREFVLNEQKEMPRERRLVRYLDPSTHFTQQKQVTIVRKGESFRIADLLSAEFELYDSLSRVHALLTALNDNPTFAEFSFLLTWPALDDDEKQEKYSRYACHELNIFLARKDPAFFKKVIRPYLANKMDKTFIDQWLLDADLTDYLEPWEYSRLNMTERILLGQAIEGEWEATARHIKERYDLLPQDIERYNREFRFALRSRGLDGGPQLEGLSDAMAAMPMAPRTSRSSNAPAAVEMAATGSSFKSLDEKGAALAKQRSSGKAERRRKVQKELELEEIEEPMDAGSFESDPFFQEGLSRDRLSREAVRQLYRKLGPTEEWVENNYYHLPIEQQLAGLVKVSGFWKDYAASKESDEFLSTHITEANGNFAEMILAMASLELPFTAGEHKTSFADGGMTLIPGSDIIIYHKQVSKAASVVEKPLILVSQNFFAQNDRYRHVNNERFDKFITRAFEAGRVYGCQVVLTNPTSSRRKVDVLAQIPAGAIAVLGGMKTHTRHMALEPYSTQTMEYFFYFPQAGDFEQYPVHVAQNDEVIGYAAPFNFHVIKEVIDIDEESWEHVSQFSDNATVAKYLEEHNIDRLDLDLIAFRMRDRSYFKTVTDLLRRRHVYSQTLWAYSLYNKDRATLSEYLPNTPVAQQCGRIIDSPLLTLNPVHRHVYQHKEYWPLVNARVYKLGGERKILNREFYGQYTSFLQNLRYRKTLTDNDLMTLVVYLLVQDRVEQALHYFERINADKLEMKVPYDYMKAYLAFYREAPAEARKIAEAYKDYPVERWRKLFGAVLAQCDEIDGGKTGTVDDENRTETQTQLATSEPRLELIISDKQLLLEHANLQQVTLNFYPMDIELLFSRQPFVQDVGDQFAMIRPNDSVIEKLKIDSETTRIQIPDAYQGRDVMIEAVAAGIRKRVAHYPNALRVDLMENYGQLKVSHRDSGKPLAKVYVKVYARQPNGITQFFKDGYTDLRGRFDYASLNTGDIDHVQRFAVLVLSDEHGAVVKEASPPTR